jgi:hypothetical protein
MLVKVRLMDGGNMGRNTKRVGVIGFNGVAASVGFGSADVFRRRFESRFGIVPKIYRERFLSARQIEVSRTRTMGTTL